MAAALRLLVALPQLPEDPTSRTPWELVRVAEALAAAHFEVRILATTATERAFAAGAYPFLQRRGYGPRILPAKSGGRVRPEIHYQHAAVERRAVDVGNRGLTQWDAIHGKAFDAAFDDELRQFRPDIVLTYPSGAADFKRHARACKKGAKAVLALPDSRWLSAPQEALACYAAALTHSTWLAARYSENTALRPVTLPPPVPAADVVADEREPVCVTFIHPSFEHGSCLLLRLAGQLSLERPQLPILILSSSGAERTGEGLIEAGLAAGIDLRQFENILVSEAAQSARDTWAATQILVAPALANPPVTLAAEALVNGIPVVTADRAGMPEALNGAGFVLPLPLDYTEETRSVLPVVAVEPWLELLLRLSEDDAFYAVEAEKARAAACAFDPQALAPRYAEFFTHVAEGRSPHE